ncbi:MAG: class I SAM-dependent methyltransferase [Natronosporangium sp.]
MRALMRSAYTWTFAAAGLGLGLASWALGPTVALAVTAGGGLTAGLLLARWLRLRHRWIGVELGRLRTQSTQLEALVRSPEAGLVRRPDLAALQRRQSTELAELRRELSSAERRMAAAWRKESAQLQALQNLHAMVPTRHRMLPLDGGWAVAPDFMLLLVSLVRERRPATIVELGSGASTVWTALALQELGIESRMVAVDHDVTFAERTRERLTALGLEKVVEVRHAPLVDVEVDGEVYPWYDRAAFADVDSCDLLVVDGPPGILRSESRYPALPLLGERICPGGQVLMDDLVREDEQHIVARWVAQLPGWRVRELSLAKGAALLTKIGG